VYPWFPRTITKNGFLDGPAGARVHEQLSDRSPMSVPGLQLWKGLLCAACVAALAACGSNRTVPATAPAAPYSPVQLAKTDIDRVAEAQQREIFINLKLLTEKLYRRNPRELRKSGQPTLAAGVSRIFEGQHEWKFAELKGTRDIHALQLAFRDDYGGDRVLAFVVGLASMIQTAFNDKTEFFVLDDLDAQRLYNAARNAEIAVWKLSTSRSAQGQLYLLSNATRGPLQNLSYEREFGKIINSLDVTSKIVADKNKRAVVKVVQSLATAVFLPIR
jgi:hypothetical protein